MLAMFATDYDGSDPGLPLLFSLNKMTVWAPAYAR